MIELHCRSPRLFGLLGRGCVLAQDDIPSAGEVAAAVAQLWFGLPAAVLKVDAGAARLGAETHLDFRRGFPIRTFPRQEDQMRRVAAQDPADLEFAAVGEAFVESADLVVVED